MSSHPHGSPPSVLFKWVLDTRPLWPDASSTADLAHVAARAFALLSGDEKTSILLYHFLRDAKLALASVLLKRLAISTHAGVGWARARPTRDGHGKPNFLDPADDEGAERLLFNVSHQAGLVVLLGLTHPRAGAAIGIDLVCPAEPAEPAERDRAALRSDGGWAAFVDVYASVFADAEARRLKTLPWRDADRRLRCFYALWCYREAYVKMTGEALVAPWLPELEVRYVVPPGEPPPEGKEVEVWFRGRAVEGVSVRMEWLLDEYMVAIAVRGGCGEGRVSLEGKFTPLDLDEVLRLAEAAQDRS